MNTLQEFAGTALWSDSDVAMTLQMNLLSKRIEDLEKLVAELVAELKEGSK